MNEQELINELTKYVKRYENVMDEYSQGRYGAYKVSLKLVKRLNEQNITDEQAWNKVAEAYPESPQSLRNTLDNAVFGKAGEPQKPVVPQFVAEWFEENKDDLEFPIWELCVDSHGSDAEQGMLNWIQQSENKPIETLIRMKDGYVVEKEPLYYVDFINDGDVHKRLVLDHENGKYNIVDWSNNLIGLVQEMFTEAEIKAINGHYWAFNVAVEEVTE